MSGNPPKTCRGEKWTFHEENFHMKKPKFSGSPITDALKRPNAESRPYTKGFPQ